uniref:Uncharacterized protein LOC111120399 n=1 Tax=Crassostrea virginica TaxID=6565 RepID=A0A8B8CLU1_CRAVI|nr:uncharacterized protein LOC111120399 [Crassostrea virginica]
MLSAVVWISLIGISLTSSISLRGGGHNHNVQPNVINCPTCEHHICDLSSLVQCEVCEIHVPHSDQPPQDVKCAQAGHCHVDNHHHCCSTEACVAKAFGSYYDQSHHSSSHSAIHTNTASFTTPVVTSPSNTNSSSSTRPPTSTASPTTIHITEASSIEGSGHNVPLITCPTCEHHVCDLSSLVQCETCEIHVPHSDQPPVDVKCVQAGNCHVDKHHHCCSTEACVESFFGKIGGTTIHTMPHAAVSCPLCRNHVCEHNNLQFNCIGCLYNYDHGSSTCLLPETAHNCKTTDKQECCKTEECIVRVFGKIQTTAMLNGMYFWKRGYFVVSPLK